MQPFIHYDNGLISIVDMTLKLILSAALGGLVGWEREVHERPAGLRTHILVCIGATLITLVSVSFGAIGNDPGRIAAQIVSGIGFLGAGTILRQGNIIRGLTTAASLWTVSGIGIAIGVGGMYAWLAIIATFIVFLTLSIMRRIEPALGIHTLCNIGLEISEKSTEAIGHVLASLSEMGVEVGVISSSWTPDQKRSFKLRLQLPKNVTMDDVIKKLSEQPGVDQFECS